MTSIANSTTRVPALRTMFVPAILAEVVCSAPRGRPVGISCSVSPVHRRHARSTARSVDGRDITCPFGHPGRHRFVTSRDLASSVRLCVRPPIAYHRPGGRNSSLRSSEQS